MTSQFDECKTCGEWGWVGTHVCPPAWIVAPEQYPDEMMTVYGHDAEEAAENWAERYDCDGGEYYLARGNEQVVLVGRAGESEILRVNVAGETVPKYRANTLGPAPNPHTEKTNG